ncbi:MAG TPA: glycerophosphodiester phosphodiesterase family protein [Candidatus Saccharibacteria bacterium]|nr:glycerophosphodiester phosphodiesterase family protein [Candidatus Saccharibacteria bacterium]
MKIIGHRGAAGLAPENTILSIQAAVAAGVDAIEFDVRAAADETLVVCHDASLERTYDMDKKIRDITSKEIRSIKSKRGDPLPVLDQVMEAAGSTPLVIECKGGRWAKALAQELTHKKGLYTVISFNHHELFRFKQLCPAIDCYVLEQRNPFDAINAARIYGFDGIDVSFWTLNPLVYWLARRHHLKVVLYTVNYGWLAGLLRIFYPSASLTTDYPNRLQYLRPRKLRQGNMNRLGL